MLYEVITDLDARVFLDVKQLGRDGQDAGGNEAQTEESYNWRCDHIILRG